MSFLDLFRSALSLIGASAPPLVYLAEHAGKLVKTAADGRSDVIADDESVGGTGGVVKRPVLVGLPGVCLDISTADRVRWGFAAGSPTDAEIRAFEQDRSADRNVARKGDRVTIGEIRIVNNPYVGTPTGISIMFTPSPDIYGGVSQPPQLFTISGPIVVIPNPTTIQLDGWISTGSPEIMFRRVDGEEIP